MRNAVLLFLLFSLLGCASTESKQLNTAYQTGIVTPQDYQYSDKQTFSVLTWNLEHFVDVHDDPYVDNRRENDGQASVDNRLKEVVDALKKADADIVVLQEFESAKFLRQIVNEHMPEMGYRFFADAPSHTWYMNVVVMSRFPLGIMYSYGNVTTPVLNWTNEEGKRESQSRLNTRAWSIDVYPSEDYNFLMTAVHLKAGRGERDVGMRLGQIEFLKGQFQRFLKEDPSRNMLMLGDFNALPGSTEMNALLGKPTDLDAFVDPLEADDHTHPADIPVRRLDYIIYNKNMADEAVAGSAKPIYLFDDPKKQDDMADHLPVIATFYLSDKK